MVAYGWERERVMSASESESVRWVKAMSES